MSNLTEVSSSKSFGGFQKVFSHKSKACNSIMKFSIYLPPSAITEENVQLPVLYFLAGLTCTTDNFIIKSGFQRYAAEHSLIVVSPDTSPRDTGIEGEVSDDIYVGSSASFYLDCSTPKWKKHYNMFTYVTKELIEVVEQNFPSVLPGRRGISGHSMGGHGALICGLKRPNLYTSLSTLAPVTNASSGSGTIENTFAEYLGPDRETWKEWDACELARTYNGRPLNIKFDIGACDEFWAKLKPGAFVEAVGRSSKLTLDMKVRAGYDHDYYFVSSIIEEHIFYHANQLK